MLNEVKIDGLRNCDKVFKAGNKHVKIRLEKKEVLDANKLHGPAAIAFYFTASVCDKNGKAIRLGNDRVAILPHCITIPLMDVQGQKKLIKKDIDSIIEPLIQRAVQWHKNLETINSIASEWETRVS